MSKLRFLLVDGNVVTWDGCLPEDSTSQLYWLSDLVLKQILAYMSIDNILNGIGVTTKGMMGRIRGLCRIKRLVIDDTFESRQMQVLASTTYISEITCLRRLKSQDEWSRLMSADAIKNITSLELKPCPTNHFWLHVPHQFLARIKHLSVTMDYASDLPFEHLTNVVGLRWDVESDGSKYVRNLAEHLQWLRKLELLFVKDTIARTKSILCTAKELRLNLTGVEIFTGSTLLTYLDVYLDDVDYVGVYYNSRGSGVMHGFSFGPKLKNLMRSCLCLQLVSGPSQTFGSRMEKKIRDFVAPIRGELEFSRITNRRQVIEHARIFRFREYFVRDFPFLLI